MVQLLRLESKHSENFIPPLLLILPWWNRYQVLYIQHYAVLFIYKVCWENGDCFLDPLDTFYTVSTGATIALLYNWKKSMFILVDICQLKWHSCRSLGK